MKTKAKRCAKEAQRFHEKLHQLSTPTRFFTDEEVLQFKKECAPLLKEITQLYDSLFISNDYLDRLKLKDFLDERKFLNHIQYKNNQAYKSQS